ncbi:FHIPEP family type III secretion protein [Limnobacter sp.]|uniref:FHIPEP family type III secretion protein n=1 Tax=Limnobacter sp. TaxID=2003368 RepID=UPI003515F1E1
MIAALNRFARLASARSEVVGASLIVLMIVMMVVPISPSVLDVLLALNISVAILLVISAVLIESPLAFSSFPAILLMTTLFRLSLTISTTRQILLEADAGQIVQTFGEFVVGGNVAVGLIIFIIISVVNFLVITKGSERVAEVAARFSLDGMPGKQMSIDGDLRAGLITQTQAKAKRAALEKESQLFGAMDGAIKFVKNDAIAGLIITVVNLLGGLAVGMLQLGMDFSTAGNTFVILSVGDGLVGIIPSLMISIAAGLIVTRVTKGEADGSSTASDMILDLTRNTNALQISGIVCFAFAFVPGMPSIVFLCTSAGFIAAWHLGTRLKTDLDESKPADTSEQVLEQKSKTKLEDVLQTKTFNALEVRLPHGAEPTLTNLVQNICRLARNRQVEHLGILLPLFEFTSHSEPDIEFFVYGVPCLTIKISDKRMALRSPKEKVDAVDGLNYTIEKDPISGKFNMLCDPVQKPLLEANGIEFVSYENRLVSQVEALLVKRIDQLFTLNEYQAHITGLGEQYAEQLKELERVLPSTKVVDILQRLLNESVSIKNMRSVLNSLIDWGQRERDTAVIGEQVRRVLNEQICHQYARQRKLHLFMLDTEFEQLIREATRSNSQAIYLDIDSTSLNYMVDAVEEQIGMHTLGEFMPGIVCSMDCRLLFRQIIQDQLFGVPVLSHQELSKQVEIQVMGSIYVEEPSDEEQEQTGAKS